jgi:hypothetical protein
MKKLFLTETLAGTLMTALCLILVHLTRRRSVGAFALLGVTLALLALTRPVFYHFWLLVVAMLGVVSWRVGAERRGLVRGALVFLLCFFTLILPWMIRNARQFGHLYIAEGGGVILKIRAGLNGMTRQEYLASFLYWSTSRYAKERLLARWFPPEAVARLDEHAPEGILRSALAEQDQMRAEHPWVVADRILWREGRREILRHPFRHLLATIPIGLRGVYVRGAAMSLLMFGGLMGAFVFDLRGRRWIQVICLSPAVTSFALHAIATINIPRYSIPIIPMVWVGFLILVREVTADRRRDAEVQPT